MLEKSIESYLKNQGLGFFYSILISDNLVESTKRWTLKELQDFNGRLYKEFTLLTDDGHPLIYPNLEIALKSSPEGFMTIQVLHNLTTCKKVEELCARVIDEQLTYVRIKLDETINSLYKEHPEYSFDDMVTWREKCLVAWRKEELGSAIEDLFHHQLSKTEDFKLQLDGITGQGNLKKHLEAYLTKHSS